MASSAPVQFINRKTGKLETEKVLGEGWMRWLYQTGPGQLALHALVKRALLSHYFGWRMNWRYSAQKVLPFIVEHNLDVDEMVKNPLNFRTFNEFFARALKPEARPIAPGDDIAVLPADGRHLAFQNFDEAEGFYVKGEKFRISTLLDEDKIPDSQRELLARYRGGAMLISRLAPVDYHRYHFPVAGVPTAARLVEGSLFSVSPIALRRNVGYLIRNKRMLTTLDAGRFGKVMIVEIGATMVGSIHQTYVPGRAVAKGEEKGFFKFGGSCTITLFEPGRIVFDRDLVENSIQNLETYARMGERLGVSRL
jgi:phosphatidylserine decarboxylase